MNKLFSISLFFAAALSFASCVSEEDDIFDKSAAERLNETSALYTERLKASPGGWTMEYYPTNDTINPQGMGYLMLVKFGQDNSTTVAMNNQYSNNVYKEATSAFEVIADNGPVLTFNTYNACLHTFSSPEDIPSTSKDEQGLGFEGDYEFIIIDAPENGDHIMLKGKKRGTYVRLSRLDEGTDFKTNLSETNAFMKKMFSTAAPNMDVVHLGDSVLHMKDASTGRANLYPYDGDAILDENNVPFLITERGGKYYLRFKTELTANDGKTAQEFVFDEAADKFTSIDNPEITVEGEQPVSFFKEAMNEGHKWRYNRSSEQDNTKKDLVDKVRSEFKSNAGNATFNYIAFTVDEGEMTALVNYKPIGSAATNLYYKFTLADSDKGLTLAYSGAKDQYAQNYIDKVPSLQSLLETFSGDYALTAGTTQFNLTTIRLTADDNNWITLTYLK